MHGIEMGSFNPESEEVHFPRTSERLKTVTDFWLKRFVKEVEVSGKENIESIDAIRQENPEAKFIVSSSHFSDLDAPATISVLGEKLDLQITAESVLFGMTPEEQVMFRIAGKDNFKPISYKNTKSGKEGVFDPEDFNSLAEEMQLGKTPWIASHAFSAEKGGMDQARIGPVYLAHKTDSYVIPTAIEIGESNMRLDTPLGILKAMRNKVPLKYHVGEPMKFESVDISSIDHLLTLRKEGKKATKEEIAASTAAHKKLKEQAGQLAQKIAEMLPEHQR